MATLKLEIIEETKELPEIDQRLWLRLGEKVNYVMDENYVAAQTVLDVGKRRGRSGTDIPSTLNVRMTVQNRITSLYRILFRHLERRLEESPTLTIIVECGKCMDMEEILEKEDNEFKNERIKSLKNILNMAKYEKN